MNDIEVLKKAGLYIEERKPSFSYWYLVFALIGTMGFASLFLILLGV